MQHLLIIFIFAAGKGHKEVVKVLWENGANMDHQDIWGYTPLSVAGKYLSTYLHLPTTKSNETICTAISFLRN